MLRVFQGGPRQESYRYAVTPGTEKKKSKKKKGKENLENLKQELEMDEHKIPIEELYERLGTDPNTVCQFVTLLDSHLLVPLVQNLNSLS